MKKTREYKWWLIGGCLLLVLSFWFDSDFFGVQSSFQDRSIHTAQEQESPSRFPQESVFEQVITDLKLDLTALASKVAHAKVPSKGDLYFDHAAHGIGGSGSVPLCEDGLDNDGDGRADQRDAGCKRMAKAKKRLLECQSCHGKNGRKRLKHTQCQSCHNLGLIRRKMRPRTATPHYCKSCHTESSFRMPKQSIFRPAASRARFHTQDSPDGGWSAVRITFNHERHALSSGVCESCHTQLGAKQVLTSKKYERIKKKVKQGKAKLRGEVFRRGFDSMTHAACEGCHKHKKGAPKLEPQMSNCVGCHQITQGAKVVSARLTQTTSRFSHWDHKAALDAPLPCQICHTKVGQDKNGLVSLPDMGTCGTCHNGEQAFSVGESCDRCHQPGSVSQ